MSPADLGGSATCVSSCQWLEVGPYDERPAARWYRAPEGCLMVLTYVCFLPGSLNAALFADLVANHHLGFAPTQLRTDRPGRSGGVKYSAKALDRLRSLEPLAWATVEGSDGSLSLSGIAGWPAQVIVWKTERWPPEELIETAATVPGFVATMIGDGDDVFWQSADQINTYQVYDRPWRHLPTVWDDVFGREKIDVSNNPGRQAPAPGMWLWAAAKLWFGPQSFRLLDRDRVVGLSVGNVTVRPDGIVTIALFDLDDDIDRIRDVQRRFRAALNYDGLEPRARQLAAESTDPTFELETGTFEHGGVRRITEWFRNDLPAPRSIATTRRCSELDEHGTIIWQETSTIA